MDCWGKRLRVRFCFPAPVGELLEFGEQPLVLANEVCWCVLHVSIGSKGFDIHKELLGESSHVLELAVVMDFMGFLCVCHKKYLTLPVLQISNLKLAPALGLDETAMDAGLQIKKGIRPITNPIPLS